jgi:hypothetical protein
MPPVRKRRANKPNLETNTPADAPAEDRRTEMREAPPDSPPGEENGNERLDMAGSFTPSEDGGVAQHPIHHEDQDHLTTSGYERELDRLDAAARSQG